MAQSQEGQISFSPEPEIIPNLNQKNTPKTRGIQKPRKLQKQKGAVFTSANYRRQKCDYFNKGHCAKGDDCTYRHDFVPDTAKKICKFFLSGACSKDPCQYSHNTRIYPCRFFHIQKSCQQGINCRFSHDPIAHQFTGQYMKDNKDYILKLYRQSRLHNQDLLQYIKDDIPKRELSPPPISPDISIKSPIVKKDPRQRIVKQKAVSPVESKQISPVQVRIPIDPRIKKQEKHQQKRQEESKQFYTYVRSYFHFYY